jgi:hypothetical protein
MGGPGWGLTTELKFSCPPGHSLQETIKFLKVQVEDHRQELQTGVTSGL